MIMENKTIVTKKINLEKDVMVSYDMGSFNVTINSVTSKSPAAFFCGIWPRSFSKTNKNSFVLRNGNWLPMVASYL